MLYPPSKRKTRVDLVWGCCSVDMTSCSEPLHFWPADDSLQVLCTFLSLVDRWASPAHRQGDSLHRVSKLNFTKSRIDNWTAQNSTIVCIVSTPARRFTAWNQFCKLNCTLREWYKQTQLHRIVQIQLQQAKKCKPNCTEFCMRVHA